MSEMEWWGEDDYDEAEEWSVAPSRPAVAVVKAPPPPPSNGPRILTGDCLAVMADLAPDSVAAIITDPPYGLGFMGKEWDALPPGKEWAEACLRVLKPGGHLLAFGGTRTWHRLAVAVEDAGFELRDSIAWLYGSGFPKSLDVSKAIDKAAGAEREVVGEGAPFGSGSLRAKTRVEMGYRPTELNPDGGTVQLTAPATDAAQQWQGWGTALKPAFEPIVVARKPLSGTVAANVLQHGTGALNIDGCRIATEERMSYSTSRAQGAVTFGTGTSEQNPAGRWPANVILDETTAPLVDQQSGISTSPTSTGRGAGGQHGKYSPIGAQGRVPAPGDTGGASRFFYCAKAPKRERPNVDGVQHPTVKPLDLMRWLVRLVTPPGGVVLDPFSGSGTTVEAAMLEGFGVIGIEREADYLPLIHARIERAERKP